MEIVFLLEQWLWLALGVVALAIELWALADCLRRKGDHFQVAFKRTKGFWTGLTAASAAVGALALFGSGLPTLMLFQLAAVSVAAVYLADVKPALNELKGSGGSAYGPHGSW
ncbi:DUF2516 family protein [Arthrobacter sp. I2-34]|uniref:DUF2516 family protein n=1 Tax=Arthrobacter hankyongi TaxID=2904801 RepID=A0ABS9L8F7_9MICC|nr:DUF2516 family protein [Arthrobacter hankyongi]MCG2622945.1 DUF2516 family protein [Arthrobacter hankyongi]